MINILINSMELIINSLIAVICSFSIYFSLKISKQNWVNTYHHLITYLLLPQIGMIIPYIITDDLALSLGMVGALSIIRFRNPVKNPLELVIFFGLLTIGISLAKKPFLGILLALIICSIILGIYILKNIFGEKLNLFSLSFNEGVLQNTLEVESSNKIELLENSDLLKNYYFDNKENTHIYKISTIDKKKIFELKEKLEGWEQIKNINIDVL